METRIMEVKMQEEPFIENKKKEETNVNIKKMGKWARLFEWIGKHWIKR